jgi:hypothetical protein
MTIFVYKTSVIYTHEIFATSTALGPTQLSVQWETRFFLPGVKFLMREDYHSPSSITVVKNYTSTP